MKRLLSLPVLFPLVLIISDSCKKYEEGPALSVRSKKARLDNVWKAELYYENDVDKTSDFHSVYTDARLTIGKDGSYSMYYKFLNLTDYNETGTWKLSSDKEFINFYRTSPNTDSWFWRILRLKDKELWVESADSNSVNELRMIPY